MKIYAVAAMVTSVVPNGNRIDSTVLIIETKSKEEAIGLAYTTISDQFPVSQGYSSPNLCVLESTFASEDGGKTYSKHTEDEMIGTEQRANLREFIGFIADGTATLDEAEETLLNLLAGGVQMGLDTGRQEARTSALRAAAAIAAEEAERARGGADRARASGHREKATRLGEGAMRCVSVRDRILSLLPVAPGGEGEGEVNG